MSASKYFNVGTAYLTAMNPAISVAGKADVAFSFQVSACDVRLTEARCTLTSKDDFFAAIAGQTVDFDTGNGLVKLAG